MGGVANNAKKDFKKDTNILKKVVAPSAKDLGLSGGGGGGEPVKSPGQNTWPSIYPNGFPDQWGQLSPMPVVNPLSQAQWYTPQQIDAYMTRNSEVSGLRGPSALAAGSFMARLAALQGQNGGGNNGA